MTLRMSGLDWESAKLAERGRFGFSGTRTSAIVAGICSLEGLRGCVLLATCNRTELYLSIDEGVDINPSKLLCKYAEVEYEVFSPYFKQASGEEAVRHIMEVACGLRSQILGEEQILTQIREAAEISHELNCAGSVLLTLFRLAVTAGKEARTRVVLSGVPPSVAGAAILRANDIPGGLSGKQAVVIGNGKMGRLCAEQLRGAGCNVTVTLRSYRHGQTVVPHGCGTVPYDERMSVIDGCDLLVSATTSPHFTVSKSMLEGAAKKPKMIIDLAVPRDIEPEATSLPDIVFIDMDTLTPPGAQSHNEEGLAETELIIDKHFKEFYRWLGRRNGDT